MTAATADQVVAQLEADIDAFRLRLFLNGTLEASDIDEHGHVRYQLNIPGPHATETRR